LANSPNGERKRRGKLNPEDELIKIKMEHDMEIEKRKQELEETKHRDHCSLEMSKVELENKRLDVEAKKQEHKSEKNKTQLNFLNSVCGLFTKFIDKNQ